MKRLPARWLLTMVLLHSFLASCAFVDRHSASTRAAPEVDAPVEPLDEIAFRVLHKADYNIDDRPTFRNFLVLTDAQAYAAELKNYSIEFPAGIDFNSNSIVVATMGTQASGGYAITAMKAEEYEDRVVVQYAFVSPAENCLTTQAQSNPYEFVVLPTRKPLEFIEVTRVQRCE